MQARLLSAALACLAATALFAPLAAAHAPPSGWTTPWSLDGQVGAYELHVAALPGGRALAVWGSAPSGAVPTFIVTSEFTPGEGWSSPAYTQASGFASTITLAVNPSGYGIVTWVEWVGIPMIQASFYRAGQGLSVPTNLYDSAGMWQGSPASTIDDGGTATVIFAESNGTAYVEVYARGNATYGLWEAIGLVETNYTAQAVPEPGAVYASPDGTVHGVYARSDSNGTHLWGSNFTESDGWSAPRQLDNNTGSNFREVRLAGLSDGRVAATWLQVNLSGSFGPATNAFSPASGWAFPETELPTIDYFAGGTTALACGGPGMCVVGWPESFGAENGLVLSWSTDGGATFGPPERQFPTLQGQAWAVDIALARTGEGMVVWSQTEAGFTVPPTGHTLAAEITAGGALGPLQRLDRMDTQHATGVTAAVGPAGQRIAGWIMPTAGKTGAMATVYSAPDTSPPSLRVTAPLAGAQLSEASAVVTGQAEPGASVSVNGELALVRAEGSFALRVPLTVGNNTIRVIAWDEAGNNETALVPVTVSDPTSALAAQLSAANLTIVQLTQNVTTLEEELNTSLTLVAILNADLASMNQSWADLQSALSDARDETASAAANASAAQAAALAAQAALAFAEANASSAQATAASAQGNATAAHEAAHVLQQRVSGMHDELNATQSSLTASQASVASAQSTAASATTLSMIGALAGVAGIALALVGRKHTHFEGGGTGLRQTPKRDFGDRMKAGLDTAAGIPASGATASPRDAASGQATGKRQHGASPDVGGDGGAQDPLSVEASAESEEGDEEDEEGARGPRQSTSLDGSYAADRDVASGMPTRSSSAPRDAASGQATGKRQHGPGFGPVKADAALDSKAPRDAASGQATGKRQHEPAVVDLDGDGAAERDVKAPRDIATGQASGKRQHSVPPDVSQDGRPDVVGRGPRQSTSAEGSYDTDRDAASGRSAGAAPRDAASGQATGKRQHGAAAGDVTGDGRPDLARGPRQSTSVDGSFSADRDVASGLPTKSSSAPRDAASGQATGKRSYAPSAAEDSVTSPRDAASGLPTGKRVAESPGGDGRPDIAANEEGEAVRPPRKKPQ